jgi:hypothetical protein
VIQQVLGIAWQGFRILGFETVLKNNMPKAHGCFKRALYLSLEPQGQVPKKHRFTRAQDVLTFYDYSATITGKVDVRRETSRATPCQHIGPG